MSYRIEKGEGLAAALQRIAAEETHLAINELSHEDHGQAIHSARKSIKRLRALLRAVRVVFSDKAFRGENQRLARMGRKISPLRDIHVQLHTLGKLRAAHDRIGARVRRDLMRQEEDFARKVPRLREDIRNLLDKSNGSIESWPLAEATPDSLSAGIKKVYRQGQRAFADACKSPTTENLHECRKKTKALGYGFELIQRLAHKKVLKMMQICGKMGDALGDDHDLCIVSEALEHENRAKPDPAYDKLAGRIKDERARLQRKAFKLGRRLYKDKPGVFAKRIERSLDKRIWQS
jgi:CHAD domain-containing protein